MTDYLQVLTTVPTRDAARAIARLLLDQRLAACVQIVGPIESSYWWQGVIETSEEWQCVAKTRLDFYERLEAAILSAHPYDVPEIVATRIERGQAGYLDWLAGQLK
jgi:periplasmic divalent cation tolerance protein